MRDSLSRTLSTTDIIQVMTRLEVNSDSSGVGSCGDSQTSDSSGSDFYNNYACNVRRSATLYNNITSKTATLNRRQYSRNTARLHTNSYSSATLSRLPSRQPRTTPVPRTEYTSATLGRRPRHWDSVGSCEDIINQHIPTHLSETDLYYGYRQGRKVKRTESFV